MIYIKRWLPVRIIISSFLFAFLWLNVSGSNIERQISMVDFDKFQPWLYKDSDSLYVINFWATWCAPCIREIPDFEKVNELYSTEKVKVLLVSLDFPNQLQSRVLPFLETNGVKSHVILLDDPNSNRWIPLVDDKWTGAIPATVIYDRNDRQFFQREMKFEELESVVTHFLQHRNKGN